MRYVLSFILCFFISFNLYAASESSFWKGGEKIKGSGDSLVVYDKGNKIVLTGNTKIYKTGMKVTADKSIIYQKDRRFKSTGDVSIERDFDNGNYIKADASEVKYSDKEKTSKLKKVTNIDYYLKKDDIIVNAKGNTLDLDDNKEIGILKGEAFVSMPFDEEKDDGTVLKGRNEIYADIIKSYQKTESFDIMDNVRAKRLYDNGNYLNIVASNMIYEKEKLWGIIKDIKFIEYFTIDEDTKETALYKMFCSEIEFFEDKEIAEIKGPVRIEKTDKTYVLTAGSGVYNKKEGHLLFTEDPVIVQIDEQGDSVYRGDKIYFYPETKDTKLEGNVQIECLPKESKDNEKLKIRHW